jgi:hypothetical protein
VVKLSTKFSIKVPAIHAILVSWKGGSANMTEFVNGSVPIAIAAKVYGKDEAWVRAGIVAGWLNIGKATRNGKR